MSDDGNSLDVTVTSWSGFGEKPILIATYPPPKLRLIRGGKDETDGRESGQEGGSDV